MKRVFIASAIQGGSTMDRSDDARPAVIGEMTQMVVRQWHGRVHASRASEYLDLMRTVAIPDYRAVDGNLGAFCWHRRVGDIVEVAMVSWWRDASCIRAFAGNEITTARYYPFDASFLLEMPLDVVHFEGFGIHEP